MQLVIKLNNWINRFFNEKFVDAPFGTHISDVINHSAMERSGYKLTVMDPDMVHSAKVRAEIVGLQITDTGLLRAIIGCDFLHDVVMVITALRYVQLSDPTDHQMTYEMVNRFMGCKVLSRQALDRLWEHNRLQDGEFLVDSDEVVNYLTSFDVRTKKAV